jgi:methyl-accepting chemotaxis protein
VNIDELEKSYAKNADALEFTAHGLAKRKREASTIENLKTQVAQLDKSNEEAIQNVKVMIQHMGDTSNLILDPDLDSYYLMDVTLLALPQLIMRLKEISNQVEPMFKKEKLSAEDKIKVAILQAMLKESDFDRIDGDLQTSLNEDAGYNGISPGLQKNIPESFKNFKSKIEELKNSLALFSQDKNDSLVVLKTLLNDSLNESFKFWNKANDELISLLTTRKERLAKQRWIDLFLGVIAIMIASFVTVFFTQTIIFELKQINSSLTDSVESVKVVGEDLLVSSEKLAQSSQAGAISVEESVSNVKELSAQVNQTTEHAKNAEAETQDTYKIIQAGSNEIKSLLESMNLITQSSKKIEEIILIIDDIAFQTNLLALNAAVEAARAGENGKGFAVVADAVRSLATRASHSAKDISALIKDTSLNINQSSEQAKIGHKTFEQIVISMKKINQYNNEITSASQSQLEGLRKITSPLAKIEIISSENSENAEQSAESSKNLMVQCQKLKDLADKLDQIVTG